MRLPFTIWGISAPEAHGSGAEEQRNFRGEGWWVAEKGRKLVSGFKSNCDDMASRRKTRTQGCGICNIPSELQHDFVYCKVSLRWTMK